MLNKDQLKEAAWFTGVVMAAMAVLWVATKFVSFASSMIFWAAPALTLLLVLLGSVGKNLMAKYAVLKKVYDMYVWAKDFAKSKLGFVLDYFKKK